MADFNITVGAELDGSFGNIESQILSRLNAIESKAKLKLQVDTGDLQKQLGNINIKGVGKNAAITGMASDLDRVASSAQRTKAAMSEVTSKPIIAGSRKYASSLSQVNTLLAQNEKNSAKWTKAEYGRTSDLFHLYRSQQDAIHTLTSELKAGTLTEAKYNERISTIKSTMRECEIGIRNAGEATMSFGTRMKNSLQKFGQYFGVSRIIYAAVREVKEMANASIEVESAMARIQIVTGASDREMSTFFKTATSQARELGQSITDVAGSIETFSRLGYNLKDAANLSKYATIMSNVADTDVGTATTGITSIIKGYSMQASDAEHVSDVLVNVGQKYAISAEELMTAFERGGAALAASGTDFEKSAALFAATNASLQNAQTTGTMWKTVSARIRGAKTELESMGEDTSDLAEGFSKYRDELMSLTGVDIMKSEHEYKDLYEIFTELAHVWDNINGDEARARVAEILGGTRQLSGIMSTITNIKDAEGAYATAMDSVGASMKANERYMDTTAAHIGQLKATFQEFSSDFFNSSFLKGVVDAGNTILKVLDSLIDRFGVLGTAAIGLGIGKAIKAGRESGAISSMMNVLGMSRGMDDISSLSLKQATIGDLVEALSGSGAAAADAVEGVASGAAAAADATEAMASGAAAAADGAEVLASGAAAAADATEAAASGGSALASVFGSIGMGAAAAAAAIAAISLVLYATYRAATKYKRAKKEADEAISKYQDTKTELESVSSELETTKTRIDELASKKNLTIVEESELGKLKKTNEELERQKETLKNISEVQQKTAAIKAKEALTETLQWTNPKDNYAKDQNSKRVSAGGSRAPGAASAYGDVRSSGTPLDQIEKETEMMLEREQAIAKQRSIAENAAKKANEYQKELAKYDEKSMEAQINNPAHNAIFGTNPNNDDIVKYQKAKKQLEKYKKEYDSAQENVTKYQQDYADLSKQRESHIDEITPLIETMEAVDPDDPIVKRFNKAISGTTDNMDKLESFFTESSGRRAMRDYLKQLSGSTRGVGSLKRALGALGISLNDLGIDNINILKEYLDGAADAAENASKTSSNFRKSVSDIEAATESANQDKDWSTVQSAYKTAKELLKEGKTGTDDFQVMAQFLSPKNLAKAAKAAADAGGYAADEYQKGFQEVMKTADRWFGDDETKSMENFVKDFQKAGLFDVKTDDMNLWDIKTNFDTTAEAAKEFGMSVGAVETMLDSLEAYGYDFSGIERSGKLLAEYGNTLDQFRELQDSMREGEGKERFGRLLEGFDEEYEKFNDDLTNLSKEQVIHIKFEYELASIQNEIDQIQHSIENTMGMGGKEELQLRGEKISLQQQYVSTALEGLGLKKEGVKLPAVFETSNAAIEDLYDKARNTKSIDKKIGFQAEIENQLAVQQDIANLFSETNPKINADTSSVEELQAAWDNFIQTSSDGKTITINAEMNENEVSRFLQANPEKTIRFKANVDGVEKTVSAIQNEDGTITYTTEVDGKNVELARDEDGTIHYKADMSQGKPSKNETQAEGNVKYKPNTSGLPTSFSEVARKVKYKAETSGLPTAFSAITRTVRYVASGIGKFFGIGGASGTAHATGTAYARGDWRTRGRGTALGGELGPEMVVRNGRWFTIGDSGAEFFKYQPNDIVFDADQTEQLLSNGRISSGRKRGNALAEGTAFRLGGSSSSYKNTGRRSSGGGGGGSSSSKTDTLLDKFKEWLGKLFDWVEVRLERVATRIDDAAKRAERAASAGNLTAAVNNYNQAISLSKTHIGNLQSAKAKYDAQAEAVLNKAVKDKLISQSTANSIFGRDADGTIDISEYDERVQEVVSAYMAWKDKARDAADEIETIAEDITGYYKSIAETYKEVREKEMDLIRQQADNKETASSKNDLLETIASKYDDITAKIKSAYDNVSNIANTNASTLAGASVANNKTSVLTKYASASTKTNVTNAMNDAIASAKSGKPISASTLSSLTEYHRYGYISSSFYTACVQYNNALDAKEDLQGQYEIAKETAKQEKIALGTEMVDNISDELQRKFDKFEASKDLIESRQKTNKTIGYDLSASDYNTLIDYSRQQQALLTEEKRAIDAAIARNLALGLWNTSTPEYIEKQIEVEELSSKIQDCVTAQEEYNNAIMQLPYDTIEHALSLLDAIASYNESLSNLKEAEGTDLLESDYLTQIEDNSHKIEEYLRKRIQAYADYERALANGGAIGGKRAEEYLELYYEANTEINKLKEANEELKDSLRDDVWWRTFERAHEAARRLLDVVSGIADLISDDMYFKDGALSEFGVAQVANLTKQYELARQEIENYSNDILNLNDLYTDGYYTTEEYKEKLGEFQVELLNSAKNMKGYLDAIMSMYKEIDEQELKALLSLIDKRRDALKSKKDYYDYDKTIRGKTKDIKELTAQIAALEGITTAEAKAQKAKLQAQLQEAQEDLEKTQTEHHFDLLNKGLDELKDTFQNEFDEKWENLAGDLAKMAELLTAANELATQNTEQVINTLNNLLSFYGIDSARTKIDQAFASGTKRVKGNIVGLSNESGSELLVTKHGIVSHFKPGEGVVPPDLTARLFNLAQQVKPNTALGKANINGLTSGVGASITQNYGSLINIEGSADAATVADLKRMSKDLLEKSYNYTSKRMTHDYVRTGGLRRA